MAVFEAERPRLQRLACRMLGSVVEVEDAVQDARLRWRKIGGPGRRPAAFLCRTVARLCLDRIKSTGA
ncbi:sigma factor [Nannocystis pusilla]|uniref:sigma factor n=1 Tax=Nannocystis pusilla TaxID=889268 RepID=UPI003B7C831E